MNFQGPIFGLLFMESFLLNCFIFVNMDHMHVKSHVSFGMLSIIKLFHV